MSTRIPLENLLNALAEDSFYSNDAKVKEILSIPEGREKPTLFNARMRREALIVFWCTLAEPRLRHYYPDTDEPLNLNWENALSIFPGKGPPLFYFNNKGDKKSFWKMEIKRDELKKFLDEHNLPLPFASNYPEASFKKKDIQDLLKPIKKAMEEIKLIRASAKGFHATRKKDAALKCFEENSEGFEYIKPTHITEDWFEDSHGIRWAESIVLPAVARKHGFLISANAATEIRKAADANKPVPEKIKWESCLPDNS